MASVADYLLAYGNIQIHNKNVLMNLKPTFLNVYASKFQ